MGNFNFYFTLIYLLNCRSTFELTTLSSVQETEPVLEEVQFLSALYYHALSLKITSEVSQNEITPDYQHPDIPIQVPLQYLGIHRIMQWFGMEGTLKIILFQLPAMAGTPSTGQVAQSQIQPYSPPVRRQEDVWKCLQMVPSLLLAVESLCLYDLPAL